MMIENYESVDSIFNSFKMFVSLVLEVYSYWLFSFVYINEEVLDIYTANSLEILP